MVARLVNPIALKSLAKSYEEKAKILNGTIHDDMTVEERQAVKDQVKGYRTFSEKINSALDGENIDAKTFHDILNFELSGQDKTKGDTVGYEHASSLYQYGFDLNNWANDKLKAQDAIKALATKEGFEKYFNTTDNMNKDAKFSAEDFEPTPGSGGLGDGTNPTPPGEGGTTEPKTPSFTNKAGNVEPFEVGRQYATEKFNEPKITKIDEDRWQVTVPDGAHHSINQKKRLKLR